MSLWEKLRRDPIFWVLVVVTVGLFIDVAAAAIRGIYS